MISEDQDEDAARKQPVAHEPASEAGRCRTLGADPDERHQQQVAERQRVAVDRIGREPALQPVDEVERRKQQERKPQRADEGEKTRESQCDAEEESGCRDFDEIDDERDDLLGDLRQRRLKNPGAGIEIGIDGHEHAGHALKRIHGRHVERIGPIQIRLAQPQAEVRVPADIEEDRMVEPDDDEARERDGIGNDVAAGRARPRRHRSRQSMNLSRRDCS